MKWPIKPGCEPLSHVAGASIGALVLHGFTGTPVSMRPVADALVASGIDVELPRLPGHGTHIDDMVATQWADWYGEVKRAYAALAARVDDVVVIGLSMGGTLALTAALEHRVLGVVAINPLVRDRGADIHEMIDELLADGFPFAPAGPSDIADPDAYDPSYPESPLAPLKSLLCDGARPLAERLTEGTVPLRLFTSRHDHVVDPADSEFLEAAWAGPVEHTWLERGYHVATIDYDRELVAEGTVAFVLGLAERSQVS